MRYLLAVIGLALAGCGGGDDGPVSCDISDRTGTYLQSYVETSGDCGPLADDLGRLESAEPVDGYGECTKASADRWTDDGCTLERSVECADGSSLVAISTQQDSGGEVLSGTLSLTLPGLCHSVYRIEAVRQ